MEPGAGCGGFFNLVLILATCLQNGTAAVERRIHQTEQHTGSLAGGTLVTIYGSGFSENQFNFGEGNENLGNAVYFYSYSRKNSIPCDVLKEGSTPNQILCYTREMERKRYSVRVTVDGEDIPPERTCVYPEHSSCLFMPSSKNTPTIDSIKPQSGPPGTLIEMKGKIFTAFFDSTKLEANATNNNTNKITRVYYGGHICKLRNDRGEPYKLQLLGADGESDYGVIKCKPQGTYVGHLNMSFLVSGPYGRSLPNPQLLRVSRRDKIYMYQSYAEITEIKPSVGSVEGGTILSVKGRNFDSSDAQPRVLVGGETCEILSLTKDEIRCRTQKKPATSTSLYTGNRGFVHDKWFNVYKKYDVIDEISSFSTSDAQYIQQWKDETDWDENTAQSGRMRAFFVPPVTGSYMFRLMAGSDETKFYFSGSGGSADDKVIDLKRYREGERVQTKSYGKIWQNLQKGKSYYMELVHSGNGSVRLGVRQYSHTLPALQTPNVKYEVQYIKMKSTEMPEIQKISWANLPPKTAEKNEVQVILVHADGPFRLGMDDIYTDVLSADEVDDIQNQLNALPTIYPDTVSLTAAPPSAGKVKLTITFNSKRGTLPLMTYTAEGSQSVSKATRKTAGSPSYSVVVLDYAGFPSSPLAIGASADQVEVTLKRMLQSQCSRRINNPDKDGTFSFNDFEDVTSFGKFQVVSETEAFCGHRVLKNPEELLAVERTNLISVSRYFCFAYKGKFEDRITLGYYYEGKYQGRQSKYTFNHDGRWHYECIDLYNVLKSVKESHVSTAKLLKVGIKRHVYLKTDFYVDVVYLGSKKLINGKNAEKYMRISPQLLASEVTATKEASRTFNVKIKPKFGVANIKAFTLRNVGASAFSVARVQQASAPVHGTFDLKWGGNTLTGLNAHRTPNGVAELKEKLESLPGMGKLVVKLHTVADSYHNLYYEVRWWTAAGDQPPLEISNIKLTGLNAEISIKPARDGHLEHPVICGDYLRTVHDKPQVTLDINDLPTKCVGNCEFDFSISATPKVASFTPTSGTHGTKITINGEGFEVVKEKNNITIGGAKCQVSAATSTQIQCDVGEYRSGSHDVTIEITDKGYPTYQNGKYKFNYNAEISSISPLSGSIGGGTTLTVSGKGFWEGALVKIGGAECITESNSFSKIVCSTPRSATEGPVSVTVTQNSEVLNSAQKFTYDKTNIPVVTSVDVTKAKVEGGQNITIKGTGFGNTPGAVRIGVKAAVIQAFSDTEIVATLPALGDGQYPLVIQVPNKGSADTSTNNIPQITYEFRVTGMSPAKGSLYGGSRVTITGTGFSSTASRNSITIGSHNCDVISAQNSEVVCVIKSTSAFHTITNNGQDLDNGVGYAWDKPDIKIKVNDIVRWMWKAPPFVDDLNYRVEETESAVSTSAKANGFSSGADSTPSGGFAYHFTKSGSFSYWSGYLDAHSSLFMRGRVSVENRAPTTGALRFKIGDCEAVYQTGSKRRRRSTSCPAITTSITGCSASVITQSSSAAFTFSYTNCMTPTVTSMSPNKGTVLDVITIQGKGFGTQNCQNEVTIGGKPCAVVTSADTTITCKINPQDALKVGIAHEVKFSVLGRGTALISISSEKKRRFVLEPHVTSITPNAGSTQGETTVTLTGSGFGDSLSINIGGAGCQIENKSYTKIVCKTSRNTAGDFSVKVTSERVKAQCPNGCVFTYTAASTPAISSVYPTTISTSGNTLTVTGSGFGNDVNRVIVKLDDVLCRTGSLSDTTITCSVDNIAVGSNAIYVHVAGKGRAAGSVSIKGNSVIENIIPSQGGINGGLLTISGNGFVSGSTVVIVGGKPCVLQSVSLSRVICQFPPLTVGNYNVQVRSNSVTYPAQTFTASSTSTPQISGIKPVSGTEGNSITITGSGFSVTTSSNSVKLGEGVCAVQTATTVQIVCVAGDAASGVSRVSVHVAGKGFSLSTSTFTYTLKIENVSPAEGSFGGGQLITLTGKGFHADASVTVCGAPCKVSGQTTSSKLVCETPANNGISKNTVSCDVVIKRGTADDTRGSAYTYTAAKTPLITNVTPRRGGTAGGTRVTITGTGFGTSRSSVAVDIAGVACRIKSFSYTEIVCETDARRPPVKTKIKVTVGDKGIATQDKADFEYIDVWSSPFTWGGQNAPTAGDFVVIPKGQTLLLNQNTPILKMILIKGGQLIFDEKDIELKAENILITEGGRLQVGTEDQPFQHKAIITMYGRIRAPELPIYGAKTLGVRHGTLDLHGKPVMSWTLLAETAQANQNVIKLQKRVTWTSGDIIVIATTGGHLSQDETEKRVIQSVSSDGMTLTLTENLKFKHMGETQKFPDGTVIEVRAEVGHLTRNVVFRGSNNAQWNDKIKACPEGFNPGMFQVQTCFQGRHGEETGSDQFGAAIMLHQPTKDANMVTARIENVEVTYAGQAFRLGRYPIHFHLNGHMAGSYVRGCAIHRTFNRAVNIHNTHDIVVEHNVIYDIMGGAMFLEDGIETGNVFQNNLALFVRSSSSLLNDDVTPAAFWITNPNNTVRHNHVAGGTHFGFWYRMHKHPDGPSFDVNICPQHIPIQRGQFTNNTVHSNGWYGLWVFEKYYPLESASCVKSKLVPAIFEKLVTWNSLRAAEGGECLSLQFHNMISANNYLAGFELLFLQHRAKNRMWIPPQYADNGSVLKDNVIVGRFAYTDAPPATKTGLVLPFDSGLLVDGVTFINFDQKDSRAIGLVKIICVCSVTCGGWLFKFKNVKWYNSPYKGDINWESKFELEDVDGTLTGSGVPHSRVIPDSPLLPSSKCTADPAGTGFSAGSYKGAICKPDVDVLRFSLTDIQPDSLMFNNMVVSNRYGTSVIPWVRKREQHGNGWMVLVVAGEIHTIYFENANHIANLSYTGAVWGLEKGDWVIFKYNLTQKNNYFQNIPGVLRNESATPLTSANQDGDWNWNTADKELSFIVKANDSQLPEEFVVERPIQFKFLKCSTSDCQGPPDPNTIPPATSRPSSAVLWSKDDSWESVPRDGDDVTIKKGVWMVADTTVPTMKTLRIYGVLELDNSKDSDGKAKNYVIKATYIYILGGRLIVGWEDKPFLGQVSIILSGQHSTPKFSATETGPTLGSKVIGVFGGLDLHGTKQGVYWTRLAKTAPKGSRSVTLEKAVDWSAGSDIVLVTTGAWAWETETFNIVSVSSDKRVLTLNKTLKYNHLVYQETVTSAGKTYKMAAEVGLLTRNIKVIGEHYENLFKESFGARILVGSATSETNTYTGYARVSDVEFYHSGQEGYTSVHDPRFSLSYVETGTVSDVRPSYVKGCAFHHGFSPAIGVYGANGVYIDDNIVHHTVGQGMIVQGTSHRIRRNLLSLSIHPATYQNRYESTNYHNPAAIDIRKCRKLVLQDNAVAGAEFVGMHTDGARCSTSPGSEEYWSGNTIHSTLVGILIDPFDCITSDLCSKLSGFTVYKSKEFGVYYQAQCNVVLEDSMLIDNTIGFHAFVFGPDPFAHLYKDKYIEVKDSLFVGTSPAWDCKNDVIPENDKAYSVSWRIRSWLAGFGSDPQGRTAITAPKFSSRMTKYPKKLWHVVKFPAAVKGVLRVKETTFAHYKRACGHTQSDVCFATVPYHSNLNHPIEIKKAKLFDVIEDGKVFMHRPKLEYIAHGICGDMSCDSKRKFFIKDLDGSFTGYTQSAQVPSAFIPEAEWQWGGIKSYGIGDYRIPKTMLTDLNGNRIKVNSIVNARGIYRTSQCKLKPTWQAYQCPGIDYNILIFESLDADFLSRRFAPVAVLVDGYLDLTNGNRDTGICHGYPCQERLSTHAIVTVIGKIHLIHLSGTPPQHVRLFLLNADSSKKILISVYYPMRQRYDVMRNGKYVTPNNMEVNAQGRTTYKSTADLSTLIPTVNSPPGSNLFDITTNLLHVTICGSDLFEIKIKPVIAISMKLPPMTVEEFFGSKIISNLAAFLGISHNRIRVVKAVREKRSRRRKRATDSLNIQLEIVDESDVTTSNKTSSPPLKKLSDKLIEATQLGTLNSALNTSVSGVEISEPLPGSNDTKWSNVTKKYDSGKAGEKIGTAAGLVLHTQPAPLHEGVGFSVQPTLKVVDTNNQIMTDVRSAVGSWKVKATLRSGGSDVRALLEGTTEIVVQGGWANFTDLAISHSGSQYVVNFEVTGLSITTPSYLKTQSADLRVPVRPLTTALTSNTVTAEEAFSLQVVIIDDVFKTPLPNIAWKGHSWKCTFTNNVANRNMPYINGPKSTVFDVIRNKAEFNNLVIQKAGRTVIRVHVASDPPDFSFTNSFSLSAIQKGYTHPIISNWKMIQMVFDANYDVIVRDKEISFVATIENALVNENNVVLRDFNVSKGSIKVDFNVTGSEENVDAYIRWMYQKVKSGFYVQFYEHNLEASNYILVDGAVYSLKNHAEDDSTTIVVIVVVTLICLVLVAVILVILFIKKKNKHGKGKGGSPFGSQHKVQPETPEVKEDSRSDHQGDLTSRPTTASVISTQLDVSPATADTSFDYTHDVSESPKPLLPLSTYHLNTDGARFSPRRLQRKMSLPPIEHKPKMAELPNQETSTLAAGLRNTANSGKGERLPNVEPN